ncbi:DUF5123 domain-containing protein [Winogradskyella sp. SYSU M77433]|uniref:DUF5123 domain-containing protein n=1 Tax=Winogradskyella sp. SYSU M77433 TaxID=3042722 RepID=UPI0024806D7F|nr:DUF5123 domain-containing protein [Winogradskyella sp. SYSU M77433]MDH7911682.1 DUF5123 domain-containing protein [Winogradskyella sp. SYSU M77433]
MMKAKHILKSTIVILVLLLSFSGCESPDEVIEELSISREFAPVGLQSFIRNQVFVELNWDSNPDVDNYLVEFSEDPSFSTIVNSVNVTSNELPVQIEMEQETFYYIRVQAISSRGLENSTYATTTAETLTEQIFYPIVPEDILATEATFRWLPNSTVTELFLVPGNISYTLSAQEIADGVATVTGLTGETDYTVQILNNTTIRGVLNFTTGVDIGDGVLVTPSDDLFQMVADAASGDVLVLDSGDYTAQIGTLVIDKSLTIRGLYNFDKPLLKLSISIVTGATDVELIDLDLTGDAATDLTDMVRYSAPGSYNSLLVSGCNVHDYARSFIAGNETDAIVQSIIVENSIVTNIETNGGDFFDFRNSDVFNVNFNTSTFNNCAPGRDFFRIDDAGTSTQTGLTSNITLDSCTLYACSNNSSRRLLYIRFQDNDIVVSNTLITDTAAEGYSDQSRTDEFIDFSNNNYFNAPTFYDSSVLRYDNSSSYTTLDPGYVDALNGDFTLTTQSLIDNQIGDPRWR